MNRGAALMGVGTLLSRILGLVREVLIVAVFPTFVTDAFFVALRLPNMFRRLLGEGSLSVAFIPIFIETHQQKGEAEAKKLSSGVFSLLMSVVLLLTVAGTVWMQPLVEHLVSGKGYAQVPGKLELTVHLGQIMFVFILLMSLYAFFMAVLQSFRIFGLPALAPALFNVSLIVALLLPKSLFQIQGEVLAWAVIIGGGAQAGLLIPRLFRLGFFPRWVLWWKIPLVKKVVWTTLPSMLGMGILQITGFANIYFASLLEQGAHSYIYLADRILELPLSLFAVSLGSSLLPTLSRLSAKGQWKEMQDTTTSSLRVILFLSLPCALGMWFLAKPIAEVIFMNGEFSASNALATSRVIQIYSFSLIVAALVRILVPAFYAVKNTWLPAMASVFGLCVHLVGATYWIDLLGLQGLVLSTLLGSLANLIVILISYQIRFRSFALQGLLRPLFMFVLCSLPMMLLVVSFSWSFAQVLELGLGYKLTQTAMLLSYIGLAAIIYFTVGSLLKIPESQQLLKIFKRKVIRK